jgi:hypothetical protein
VSPRIWLWIGVVLLLIGTFNAITRGNLNSPYGLGYVVGSIGIGLAIIYFGWYRRRAR